ncbi:MAG TPA: hypothetical protein DCS26_07635 [Porticoccaceae bacterium]|jgi:uncharacterized protein (TIGR02001 family)|nr:hypothetical protein [Porticoccaceae bacterium]
MKFAKSAVFAATMLSAVNVMAAEVSGNVTVATDYFFRAIDQSNGEALSGGFDVAFESGFYIGTWGSSIASWGEGIELDYYAGYGGSISEDVGYDLGFMHYGYPNESTGTLDFDEIYGSVSFGDASVGFAYSDDYFGGSGEMTLISFEYGVDVTEDYSVGFRIASNKIEDNVTFGTEDYVDWSLSLGTEAAGLEFSLTYTDTDLDAADCFGGDTEACSANVTFSITKSM